MNYEEILQPAFDLSPNINSIHPVRVLSGEYKDIIFQLGKVWFEDESKLSFELDVIRGKIDEDAHDAFNSFVAEYIMFLIQEQLRNDNERQDENNTEGTPSGLSSTGGDEHS